jgi:phosphoenolpyruvate---glycerone phosphotransferase subunit DhaL
MTGAQLVAVLDDALARLEGDAEELRELDAALGDGDLGITVGKGCAAVRAKLAELADPLPADVLRVSGTAFAAANPSTLAALVGGGLLAAAGAVGDTTSIERDDVLRVGRAAATSIQTRGKAELGDKTILDALVPSLDALERADGHGAAALDAMIAAARAGVEETAGRRSQRGRASWQGERSIGKADPGATAYTRFLESVAAAL